MQFRASVCGRFIVSLIGEACRVLPVEEAIGVREVYEANRAAFLNAGRPAQARYEAVVIEAMDAALSEARQNIVRSRG